MCNQHPGILPVLIYQPSVRQGLTRFPATPVSIIVRVSWPAWSRETVNHSEKEWVVGDVHTKGMWSLFKCSIVGAFHRISRKHLDHCIEEIEWRFNNRNNPHMFRDTLRRILTTDPLHYRKLAGGRAV